jgi:hypothetical protein
VSSSSNTLDIAHMDDVIDVTGWLEIPDRFPPGTRNKVWLMDPQLEREALFKEPKNGTCEHVCEKLTERISRALGLSVPEVHNAERDGHVGSLIYSFLGQGKRLVHGGEVFADNFDDFEPYDLRAHTYQRLRKVASLSTFRAGIHDMILLDALVGNVDRHVNNWGFVSNSVVYFAPLFDNGSTLIARCDQVKCDHLRRDKLQLDGLVRNCDSKIFWENEDSAVKLRHFDLVENIKALYPKDINTAAVRFLDASVSQLTDCVADTPDNWLHPVQREAAAMLIRAWIMHTAGLPNAGRA